MTEQEKEFKDLQDHVNTYKAKYDSVGNLSDGYHTYNELYEHRCRLFMELCRKCSELRYDGYYIADVHIVRKLDNEEYFLLVLIDNTVRTNKQMSYHLPAKYYEACGYFSDLIEKEEWGKMYDGHTSEDVLKRLKDL